MFWGLLLDSGVVVRPGLTKATARAALKRHNDLRREGKARGDLVTLRRAVGIVAMKPARSIIREMQRQRRTLPTSLQPIPRELWPDDGGLHRVAVWESRGYLVQAFGDQPGIVRLSINRAEWDQRQNRWADGISWDDLQRLKHEAGYADHCAVEIYPPDGDIVDVANMRHLWVYPLGTTPPFMWARKTTSENQNLSSVSEAADA